MKKESAIGTIKELPNEFQLEDLIERLIVIEKVEQGLDQLNKGKTVTHEKVKELSRKWYN